MVGARLEELSSTGGKVVKSLGVLARANAIVVLDKKLASLVLWYFGKYYIAATYRAVMQGPQLREQPAVMEFSTQTQLAARENPFLLLKGKLVLKFR